MKEKKMIAIDIYADSTGEYSEADCIYCNCVSVQIPEEIVHGWYEENFGQEEKLDFCGIEFENTFETWLKEVYTCDDTDGLYSYSIAHGFTPVCGHDCDDWTWF